MPEPFDPFALILIRSFCAAVFFWTVTSLSRLSHQSLSKKALGKTFLCAVFGVVLNQMLFYKGLSLTSPVNAALAITILPAFVLVLAVLTGKEKFTFLNITGLVTGGAGVLFLLLNSGLSDKGASLTGDVLVVLNTFSYAIFLILVKSLMKEYHAFTVLKWLFTFGFFMQMPFGYRELATIEWQALSPVIWYSFLFVILFGTLINYTINTAVLKWVDASVAGIYFYVTPLLASVFAIALGLDSFSLIKTVLFVLILSGVWMVSKK